MRRGFPTRKIIDDSRNMNSELNGFAVNQPRESVCILIEVMPPDELNTEIALRLNRAESPAMQEWLAEAAE